MTARHFATLFLALATVAVVPGSAMAQRGLAAMGIDQDNEPYASVDLLIAATTLKPGQTVPVGVRFKLKDGWHVYWQNPGDSGEPPTFAWNLPGGGAAGMMRGSEWTATQPEFPTPIYFETGGLAGYGYEHEVIFPATLTVPASATPGQGADVTVAVNYLICSDERCVPESAVATVNVTLGMAAEPDAEATAAIEQAKASVPAKQVAGISAKVEPGRVTVSPSTGAHLFPMPSPTLDVTSSTEGDVLSYEVRAFGNAELPQTISAVVGVTTADGSRRGVIVDLPTGR